MLPAGAGALFSFFARLHTGLSYTTGREKANGILDISRFFHIWTALRQGLGPSVIGRRSRWDRRRVGPAAWVPARSRAGERCGTAYPSGGRGFDRPRGAAPRGTRRLRRGSPSFFEESRRKEHQGQAPGPRFYSRSFPLAGFWDGWLWYGSTAISSGMPKPIWDAFSGKICGKAFYERKSPNQGTKMGSEIAPPPKQCGTTAKTSEWQRAGHQKGGAGGHPPRLFASGLSLEKAWIPRPGPGGNPPRRCQPAPVQARTTCRPQ